MVFHTIINNKQGLSRGNSSILMVDDEPDTLEVLEKETAEACPDCTIEKATTL
jgi:hypothetical protein